MPDTKVNLLQGTLDMLILKVLKEGKKHGYQIIKRIENLSDETLKVEEGSLYPSLHRMENKGWIASEWGLSENNRKAKYYDLTDKGKKRLVVEVETWDSFSRATDRILNLNTSG